MKKIIKKILLPILLLCLYQQAVVAQFNLRSEKLKAPGFSQFVYGFRAGLNLSHVTNGSTLGATHHVGLVAGFFADKSYGRIYGMREEISYISSGFKFKNSNSEGNVNLQYFYLTHLFTFNLGRLVQLHVGPQTGILLNAVADSISHATSANTGAYFSVSNNTNRLTYGGCVGVEVYPYKGFLFGLRYNLSISSINKKQGYNYTYNSTNVYASNNSRERLKNQMWQIVVGWKFGCGVNR